MKRYRIWTGVVLGVLTGAAVIGVAALGSLFVGLPFFPFDLFDVILRLLPGPVIMAGLKVVIGLSETQQFGTLDQTGKVAEQIVGLVEFLTFGAVFGGLLAAFTRRMVRKRLHKAGMAIGFVLFVLFLAGDYAMRTPDAIAWAGILFVVWGAVLGRLLTEVGHTARVGNSAAYS